VRPPSHSFAAVHPPSASCSAEVVECLQRKPACCLYQTRADGDAILANSPDEFCQGRD
jgi:hypothetical protein